MYISFGSLKHNLEVGRRKLVKFKRVIPYSLQTQIIQHKSSPRFKELIPCLKKLSNQYSLLEDNFSFSEWNSSADVIRDIKKIKLEIVAQ